MADVVSHFLIGNPSRLFALLPLVSQTWIPLCLHWRRQQRHLHRGELLPLPPHLLSLTWWLLRMVLPLSLQQCQWLRQLWLPPLRQKRRRREGCSRPRHIPRPSFILGLTFRHQQCLPPQMPQNFRLLWKMIPLHQCPFLPPRTTDSQGSFQLSVPRNLKERRKRKSSRTASIRTSSMGFGTVRTVVVRKILLSGVARVRSATSLNVAHVVRSLEVAFLDMRMF